jgi:hypothetical protein
MMFHRQNRRGNGGAIYATASDFADIFSSDMESLFRLGLLLTANLSGAERCLLVALDLCTDGAMVLRQWAPSWARRSVIKSAIKIMSPINADEWNLSQDGHEKDAKSAARNVLDEVRHLSIFDRFVFVMSTLERFPKRECSVLLNSTHHDIVAARIRAVRQLAKFDETGRVTCSIGSYC